MFRLSFVDLRRFPVKTNIELELDTNSAQLRHHAAVVDAKSVTLRLQGVPFSRPKVRNFINQSFESISSIESSLKLLNKFQSILQRENLKEDLENKFQVIFFNYGSELSQVQDQYEKCKATSWCHGDGHGGEGVNDGCSVFAICFHPLPRHHHHHNHYTHRPPKQPKPLARTSTSSPFD